MKINFVFLVLNLYLDIVLSLIPCLGSLMVGAVGTMAGGNTTTRAADYLHTHTYRIVNTLHSVADHTIKYKTYTIKDK